MSGVWDDNTFVGTLTADDLEIDSGTLSIDATNNRVGIGDTGPGTQLQVSGTAPYVTLKNSTSENTEGGCEAKILFEDHANVSLAQIEGSHSGSSDDTKGKLILSTHTGSALTAAITINEAQKVTAAGDVQVTGDIIIDDGGSLKEAGGTAAITFDASGQVTTFNIPAAAVAQASDHIIFLDGGATGAPKAESIDDFLTAIAGSGVSVSSSQLTASGGGAAANDMDHILHQQVFS